MFKQLREDIACIYERDPAARSRWEILTCYPGLHAILMHRASHRLWKMGLLWLARFLSYVARIITGIEIHPGAQIGRRVFFDHGHGIVIGETAVIGDDCTIYQGVTLGGTSLYKGTKRHPTLKDHVVVGAGAQILGGFTVGSHAKVGSNAVVVKPVPDYATAVGNPARIITAEEKAEKKRQTTASVMPPSAPTTALNTLPNPCQADWTGEPLKELLERHSSRQATATTNPTNPPTAAFSAYAVDGTNDDPLVKVINELINHSAQQEQRIGQLCQALEELGQKIENGPQPLDVERLNKMME